MNKILYLLTTFIFLNQEIRASEPYLGILRSVDSNSQQKFSHNMYFFTCRSYGIVSIDELYAISKKDTTCFNAIKQFYRQNPSLKYYSMGILKQSQKYHLEFKNNRCIIYAKGTKSLSELLLLQGLGIVKAGFNDDEFNYSFNEAQAEAVEEKMPSRTL